MALLLTGCGSNFGFPGVYRIDVEQGNVITEEMVQQLKPGMSPRQVRFIMGTPLIEDTFHENRWDYRYTLRNGIDTLEQHRLTVFFEDEVLVNLEGTLLPDWAQESTPDTGADDDSDAEDTPAAS
ncbi:outer membrane lipoprotein OmlA [Luminiphilus syltensis NOR5-1B]|uniref:Outer membrane protein assembly factor BamE n=1 Tax=Luminiphilus syltensis NOR5-1B TaxID=565045 RepID=B8KWU2_9GAMM|nr:outer membrane protein assembly factor BamE [Luminiphilus syltensis]EED34447.1 outer membrane lipoprotein OmlA [Luminiphilus syltensis NOR5-1B]